MDVPERRQREKQERRESILAAAERAFVRKGLASATMEDIAREAELSKGALYLYFESKDELFLTIVVRSILEFEQSYCAVLSSHAGERGIVAVEAGLRYYVTYAKQQGERFRAAMSWTSVEYPVDGVNPLFAEYRAANGRIHQAATDTIQRGQADGSIRSDLSADRLGILLWASTLGVLGFDDHSDEIRRRLPSAGGEPLAFDFMSIVMDGVRADAAPPKAKG